MVQHAVDFMDDMPPLPLLFLYGALVGPLLALIHELGHAALALWRSNGPVVVTIAAKRRLFALRSGRFHVEADTLVRCGGVCAFDPSDTSRLDHAAIALAGPAASLLGAGVTAVLWAHSGEPLRGVLAVATVGGILAGVINALPLTYRERKRGDRTAVRLDGLHALEALRRPPMPSSTPPARDVTAGPVAERGNVERLSAQDADRCGRSIPPPGF